MGKLNSVQYLRAVAVLLVVVFHCLIRFEDAIPAGAMRFAHTGAAGVDLFFVISGFIMWFISEQRPVGPGLFMLRRIIRIVPVYWFFTLLWAGAAIAGLFPWVVVTPSHLLQSLFFIPHQSPQYEEAFPVLVPGWTLNYEMFFYAIFALCLFLPRRYRFIGLCSVLLALVGVGFLLSPAHPVASTYTNPLLLEFLAGSLIGYFYRRNRLIGGPAAAGLFALGIALLLASSSLYSDPEGLRVLAWGLPAAMMFVGALGMPGFERLNPGLLTVGNASYSIYLAHMFPVTVLQVIFTRIPGLDGTLPGLLVFLGLGVPASVVLGCLAYRVIEGPVEMHLRARLIPEALLPGGRVAR